MMDGSRFGKVAVMMGGSSAERQVSLMSGRRILASLRRQGVDAHPFDPARRPMDDLVRARFERVFVALHGRAGEDGTVQGALELLQIPHTGSGLLASALAMDKVMTKRLWVAQGLPTPRYAVVDTAAPDAARQLRRWPGELGLPLIVKPAREGSTLGVTQVIDRAQLRAAFEHAAHYDTQVLAESFIQGSELTVAILEDGPPAPHGCGVREPRTLPIVEIQAPDGRFDFRAKYVDDTTSYLCPAPLSDAVGDEVRRLALRAYRALGCRGWARVDLMLRHQDRAPFLLELNTVPGMTAHSLMPIAARAAGLDYDALVLRLLATSLDVPKARAAGPEALSPVREGTLGSPPADQGYSPRSARACSTRSQATTNAAVRNAIRC